MTGDCVGREREEGLRKYELVYDLAAGSIKKGKDCKQDAVYSLFEPFPEDVLPYGCSQGHFFHRVTLFLVRSFNS